MTRKKKRKGKQPSTLHRKPKSLLGSFRHAQRAVKQGKHSLADAALLPAPAPTVAKKDLPPLPSVGSGESKPAARKRTDAGAGSPLPTAARGHVPYGNCDRILLVGEGNFSFARALGRRFRSGANIVATAYDTEEEVHAKYPEARDILDDLRRLGTMVVYGVDAQRLHQDERVHTPDMPWDKVVFNFPHVGLGISDVERNVEANQQLILHFMASAHQVVHPTLGEVHVTTKSGPPYDLWDVIRLGRLTNVLELKKCINFRPLLYEGYHHRRTIGHREGLSKVNNEELVDKRCRTYIFRPKPDEATAAKREAELLKRKRKKRALLLQQSQRKGAKALRKAAKKKKKKRRT